ncbi:hypothetical protein FJZ19_00695 [Candidatus Pacearchaeota archaeon]|nr:hypothetical protein [Candidatus Pacearchaeota archaeon]
MYKKDKLTLKTKILREIFNIAPKQFKEIDLNNHFLAKKFHISGNELKNNIDFLVETGLIRRWPVGKGEERILELMITDKGVDFLERKAGEEKQEKFNEIVAFTGTLIALVTIYGFIVNATNLQNYPINYWIVTVIFSILVVSCLGPLSMIIINFWKKFVERR